LHVTNDKTRFTYDGEPFIQEGVSCSKKVMAIELVVFDLAGTTVHDEQFVHRVLQSALAKHDVVISLHDANEVMGIPKPVAIRTLLNKRYVGPREISEDWIEAIHDDFVTEMIHFYKHNNAVREREGVSEVFRKLKDRKLKIVVDTGFDRKITDPLLERLGWAAENLIDGSVTSDEVPRGRPHPDLIFKAMALTNVQRVDQVAKVGDTASDLQEGTAAGCKYVIGITTGAFSKAALQREMHTHLIDDIEEVLEILEAKV
jgi:phosphonatase-like hydrolase